MLRESIQLDGMPLNLIDTAGLRDSADVVEQEGIRRAYAEMRKADRLLVMVDSRDSEGDINDIHSLLPQSQQQLENLELQIGRAHV